MGSVDEVVKETLEKTAERRGKRALADAAERAKRREERDAVLEEKIRSETKAAVAALLDKKAEKVLVLNLQ